MKKILSRNEVIALMQKQQGKRIAKEFAAELGISGAYLSDIYAGKRDPGDAVLSKIGLARRIMYERVA